LNIFFVVNIKNLIFHYIRCDRTNYIFDRTINIKIKNGIEFDVNLVVSYCPEVEDEPCDQLFEESYIEFYKIN